MQRNHLKISGSSLLRAPLPYIAFALSLLTGCQGLPVEEAKSRLAEKQVCCTHFAEVQYKNAELGVRHKFELSATSTAMILPKGKSFFEGYSIPSGAKSVFVQAVASSGFVQTASQIDAAIVVLDERKVPIARFDTLQYSLDKHVILPGLWEWFQGTKIEIPKNAAYLIISADPGSIRTQIAYSENGAAFYMPSAPIGTIAFIFQ